MQYKQHTVIVLVLKCFLRCLAQLYKVTMAKVYGTPLTSRLNSGGYSFLHLDPDLPCRSAKHYWRHVLLLQTALSNESYWACMSDEEPRKRASP